MWGLDHHEGWMSKIWCFWSVVLEKTVQTVWSPWVPWAAGSNQSTLKGINPDYSLKGLMLKLKHQYFSHLMWRADSLEKTLILGKIEGRRRREWQKMRWLDVTINSIDVSLSKLQVIVKDKEAWHATIHNPWGHKGLGITEWLNNILIKTVWHWHKYRY